MKRFCVGCKLLKWPKTWPFFVRACSDSYTKSTTIQVGMSEIRVYQNIDISIFFLKKNIIIAIFFGQKKMILTIFFNDISDFLCLVTLKPESNVRSVCENECSKRFLYRIK